MGSTEVSRFFLSFLNALWTTLLETSPFLLLGLFLAGVLHVLVPPRIILWALGKTGWRGAVRGALLGTPLPLCSCSVIPTALTLRRQGASLSATSAFTISTPETSVDAIAITAALLPMAFLGVRPLSAFILAILVGTIVEAFSTSPREQLRRNVLYLSKVMDKSGKEKNTQEADEICRVCGLETSEEQHRHGLLARLRAIFGYAFGTFFRDIATLLLVGFSLAALLQIALPENLFTTSWLSRHPNIQILFAALIGIPMYTCATATTPLAAVLLAKGLSPGATLVLLLAGPGSNIANVFALRREWGGRVTFVYYTSLFVLCILIGMAFDAAWPYLARYPSLVQMPVTDGERSMAHLIPHWLEIFSAVVILSLAVHSWVRALLARRNGDECGHDHDHEHGHSHSH